MKIVDARAITVGAVAPRAGRGSEPVWFRGPKTLPKVPVIYGATSGGPNPKLMMTLKKSCPPPLKRTNVYSNIFSLCPPPPPPPPRLQQYLQFMPPPPPPFTAISSVYALYGSQVKLPSTKQTWYMRNNQGVTKALTQVQNP